MPDKKMETALRPHRPFASAAVGIAFLAASLPAAFAGPDNSQISDFKLANGLEVVVIPDHRAPVVTHMIWYKAGSADEAPGKSGIAHFFEHLMFKGTKNHPPGEFAQKVAEIGGQENAFTSYDYTAFYEQVTPEALQTMMSYEADRMRNLVLTDAVDRPGTQRHPGGAPHAGRQRSRARCSTKKSAPRCSRTARIASRSSAGGTRSRSSTVPMRPPSTITSMSLTTRSSLWRATSTRKP